MAQNPRRTKKMRSGKRVGKRVGKHAKFRRILSQLATRSNYCILECGAGPKLMSAQILPRARKVILVDPVREFLDGYRKRFRGEINYEVEFYNVAIGERGWKKFWAPPDPRLGDFGAGHGSLLPRKNRPVTGDVWDERSVQVVPLSDFDPGDIDIAIIDVEGSELSVLETMTSRPEIIAIEVNSNGSAIDRWAKSEGYDLFRNDGVNAFYLKK